MVIFVESLLLAFLLVFVVTPTQHVEKKKAAMHLTHRGCEDLWLLLLLWSKMVISCSRLAIQLESCTMGSPMLFLHSSPCINFLFHPETIRIPA